MKITTKYVLREHLGPLMFALSALTSLLLLNYISRKFADLIGKGLPWRVIGEFFVLSIPFTVAMTLPMAVLVSVLYAFSRLASENEITAFKASGVAMGRLLAPVLVAALGLAGLMVYFNDQVLPRANHRLTVLTGDIARTRPTFALNEQVLNEVTPQFIMRAMRVDKEKGTMRDVTIYDMSRPSELQTIRADSGALALAPNAKDLVLTLHHGVIERLAEGKPADLNRTFYERNLVRVRDVAKSLTRTEQGAQNYKSDREMSVCELQEAYLRSRKEYLVAKLEYDQAIADSLKRKRPEAQPPGRVFLGIGRLYCQAVTQFRQVVAVRTAGAMEWPQPPQAQPPQAQPPQDTARRDTTRRDSTRRDTVAAPPVPLPAPILQPPTPTPAPAAAPPVPAVAPSSGIQPSGADTAALPAGGVAVPPPPPATPPISPDSAQRIAANNPGMTSGALVAIARLRLNETATLMNGYDIEIHKKFALAVACIVFVLLGAPVALRFPRGGVGLVIGMSLFVFALYYCFLIAGEELATRGYLPPWISMWAANALFGAVGLLLAFRMGRESGSARGGGLGEWWYALRHRRQLRAAARRPAPAPTTQGAA
ncbi:LptF/LptG family permease [Roseisolibacter sp. H3M3-2]|uniref:LptF/LptG family permease n=1 Tax=Roseisolibacter sp. H3M3-2 TaxID=3031323 RepID=UPI0023DB35EF|nr:LptF/LptG family permease [Roseisolibacter sp. H3M3-2]MDF1502574.1 LptF/LptG family permease [Roseisolibacter sp. H3M3-2]